jgi:hypothetical protein
VPALRRIIAPGLSLGLSEPDAGMASLDPRRLAASAPIENPASLVAASQVPRLEEALRKIVDTVATHRCDRGPWMAGQRCTRCTRPIAPGCRARET